MNLETGADDRRLIAAATRVFGANADAARGTDGLWRSLVLAGWSDLGTEITCGRLSLEAAAGIFAAAGEIPVIEQLVSSGYLLPALITHLPAAERSPFRDALEAAPGVLWGDGRNRELPMFEDAADPHCFGVEEPCCVWRLSRGLRGNITLGVWAGPAPIIFEKIGELSRAVGAASLPSGGAWREATLEIDLPGLAGVARRAMLLHSCALLSAAETCTRQTRRYTMDRLQFGVPLASFQVIKHALADCLVSSEVARSALLCALADGAQDERRALVARVLTVRAAMESVRVAAQFQGGLGFTLDSDLHFYLRAVLDGSARFGASTELARELGRITIREAGC